MIYSWAVALAKISFAILYLRLFPTPKMILLNYGIIALVSCQLVYETCMPIFRCAPISRAWTPDIDGDCLDIPNMWYVSTALDIFEALVLFIQPVPTVWKLKLPLAKRLGIIFMLSLGLM